MMIQSLPAQTDGLIRYVLSADARDQLNELIRNLQLHYPTDAVTVDAPTMYHSAFYTIATVTPSAA